MAGEAILVIDDNEINLKLVRVLLTADGYDVRTAGSAEEALKILPVFGPKLILMDLQLPGMDGLELTRVIRSDPIHGRAVIVAVTAYAMKGDEMRAISAGCDGYIAKPIDTRALSSVLERFLNEKDRVTGTR